MTDTGDSCTHEWTVPADLPAFPGHFPGNPIVPGVLLLDAAIRYAEGWQGQAAQGWRIGNAKFLAPAGPGMTLCFTLQRQAGRGIAFSVRAGDRDIASGTLSPGE